MDTYRDARYRSVIKAISWRMFATIATILIVFAFTSKIILSLGVGAVEVVIKLILYYFHERLWGRISFGKKRCKAKDIGIEDVVKKEDLELVGK